MKTFISVEWKDDSLPVWKEAEGATTPDEGEFELIDEETFVSAVEASVNEKLKKEGVQEHIKFDEIADYHSSPGGWPTVLLELDEGFLDVLDFSPRLKPGGF